MRGEERLAMFLEICLICVKHAIKPWKELLRAMISVQDNRHVIKRGDSSNVLGSSNRTTNGSFLGSVLDSLQCRSISFSLFGDVGNPNLSCEVGSTSLGGLQNYGSVVVACSFQSCHNGRG